MAEKPDFNEKRYFDIEARIDTRRLDRALRIVPELLKDELMDGLDHIRRGFFKVLYNVTGIKDKRFIATKYKGFGKRIKVYRNPNKGDILDMELGIFSRSLIVSIHEKGGTIQSKTGGMLAIPIGEARDSHGRLAPALRRYSNYSEIPGIFPLYLNGKFLLVKKIAGKIKPFFILKNRVRIQPRLRFYDTWQRMEGYRMNILNKAVEKALDKA
jgi:hypothetical protein